MVSRPALVSWLVALAVHGVLLLALPHAHAASPPRAVDVDVVDTTPPALPPLADPPPLSPAPAPVKVLARPVAPRSDSRSTTHAGAGSGGETGPASPPGDGPGEDLPAPAAPPAAQPLPAPALVIPPPRPQQVPDRSRRPALERKDEWECPWPADDETEDIDVALVSIAVTVDATGHAVRVDVLIDPGHGFGRAARRCAMQQRYLPGLDRDGHAITTTTAPFRVRFVR